jgi:hypothetical protein
MGNFVEHGSLSPSGSAARTDPRNNARRAGRNGERRSIIRSKTLALDLSERMRTRTEADLQVFRNGSDGTRTRDLRRDRPSRTRPRPPTSHSKRPHLQVLSGSGSRPLRMVEPIVESTFGPRVGHEILSLWTTQRAARGRSSVLPSHDPSGCLTSLLARDRVVKACARFV